ncbi:MAG: dockerin type I repeat-containing protein [Oscillospiraceae bacterium]|nr:dockerin type I repeat-containing protein [Oscillospiraceae bacterium]
MGKKIIFQVYLKAKDGYSFTMDTEIVARTASDAYFVWNTTEDTSLVLLCIEYDLSVKGDINLDNKISVADAILLQKWLLNVPGSNLPNRHSADINTDDRIDVTDLCLLKRIILNQA